MSEGNIINLAHEGGAASPFANPLGVKEEELKDFKTYVPPEELNKPKEETPTI